MIDCLTSDGIGVLQVLTDASVRHSGRSKLVVQFFESVAAALDVEHSCVVKQTIQNRTRQNLVICQDRWPVTTADEGLQA